MHDQRYIAYFRLDQDYLSFEEHRCEQLHNDFWLERLQKQVKSKVFELVPCLEANIAEAEHRFVFDLSLVHRVAFVDSFDDRNFPVHGRVPVQVSEKERDVKLERASEIEVPS